MSDRHIIQRAADEVGQEIGKLQGKLFVAEATAESLRFCIGRLDAVYQNLQAQLQAQPTPPKPALSLEETISMLNQLPQLDSASSSVCFSVLRVLLRGNITQGDRQECIRLMESHVWKQGEAIALAQQVVQYLRD